MFCFVLHYHLCNLHCFLIKCESFTFVFYLVTEIHTHVWIWSHYKQHLSALIFILYIHGESSDMTHYSIAQCVTSHTHSLYMFKRLDLPEELKLLNQHHGLNILFELSFIELLLCNELLFIFPDLSWFSFNVLCYAYTAFYYYYYLLYSFPPW